MSYLSMDLKMKVIYLVYILLSYVEEYFSLHSSKTCKPCRSLCCLHGFCYQDIHTLKHKCACYRGFTGENCDTEPQVSSTTTSIISPNSGTTCTDSQYVKCTDQHVCADVILRTRCPLSCGLCGTKPTAAWIHIIGK